jgi:hypothetical protein
MRTSNKILLGLFMSIVLAITVLVIYVANNITIHPTINGSDFSASQERNVADFHQLECSSGFRVVFTQDSVQRVVVKADSSVIRFISTEVANGKLTLKSSERWRSNVPVEIQVSARNIDYINMNSGSNFSVAKPLNIKELKLDVSSGSSVELNGTFEKLSTDFSSGSMGKIEGSDSIFSLTASSGSNVDAGNLIAKIGSVSASSGSNLSVNITDEISVDASSGSNISYKGNPSIKGFNVSSGANFSKN